MSGWTGGQYSLYRAVLGGFVLASSLQPGLAAIGVVPAALLVVGWGDRVAAVVLAVLCAAVFALPVSVDLGWSLLAGMLLLHAALPPAPHGSLAARGRADPAGGWRMRRSVRRVAWSATALVYAYHGTSGLVAGGFGGEAAARIAPFLHPAAETELFPLTLGFAPLALFPRLRPVLWLAMLLVHGTWAAMGWGGEWHGPMVVALGMLFAPGWIPPRGSEGSDRVFYDGSCGLCHGAVRFLLAEDSRASLRFAPLDSEAFAAAVPPERRAALPDSIVVLTGAGRLETRSDATLYLASRLGGIWRLLSWVGRIVPRSLRDRVYDAVAAARYRVFGRREESCPLLPEPLTSRFDG